MWFFLNKFSFSYWYKLKTVGHQFWNYLTQLLKFLRKLDNFIIGVFIQFLRLFLWFFSPNWNHSLYKSVFPNVIHLPILQNISDRKQLWASLVTLFQLFHNFKCLAEGPGSLKKSILLINSLLEFILLFNERGIISLSSASLQVISNFESFYSTFIFASNK